MIIRLERFYKGLQKVSNNEKIITISMQLKEIFTLNFGKTRNICKHKWLQNAQTKAISKRVFINTLNAIYEKCTE